MEGRPRLRKRRAPGASPGDCRRCCVTVGGNYLGRQARPRPVAILLATAVAVAGTSGALAFTLSLIPMEWHSVVSWRWSSPGESKLRWQRVGAAYVGTVCHSRGSTSKRVSNRKILLSSAGPTESDSEALQLSVPCSPIPDESEVRREEGDHPRRHGRSTDEPSGGIEQDELGARRDATVTDRTFSVQPWRGEGLKQTGAWERDSGRTEKRGGQGDRGDRDRKRGRKWRANAKSYNSVSERSGAEVKRLSDLMVANFAFEDAASSSSSMTTNKTELSQKVEAELFGEYDAMVPGPPESLAAVGVAAVNPEGQQERTGRPLAINLDLLSYHARQKALQGEYSEAKALYRQCVQLDPRDGRGWLGLARQMEKVKRLDKAQAIFEAGLENCPDNPFLLQAFAVMEEARGNQAKALTLLNRSVRRNPDHTASWVALGLLNERNKRINEARGCFDKATKSDPGSYYAWMVWGLLEKRYGTVDEAREKFKICLRANPKNAKTYQAWGVLETEEENYNLAAELFREGLEQRAGNTYIMQAWALMEIKRGNTEEAVALFEEALVKRPHDGAVWQAYALFFKDRGDFEGARGLFRQGVERAPKHCPLWQAWAMMEWQLGDTERARHLFQEGVWENPNGASVVRILQSWAILEATEYNFEVARKYFGFALARDPYSIPVMVAWALMEEEVGDIVRARQLLEMAASTESGNPHVWHVYEQMEVRGGFELEAKTVHRRGEKAIAAALSAGNTGPNAWWEKGVLPLNQSPARGTSMIDQASRSLGTSSAEMAIRVGRIIGSVQWASDYMSFNSSAKKGRNGNVALEP